MTISRRTVIAAPAALAAASVASPSIAAAASPSPELARLFAVWRTAWLAYDRRAAEIGDTLDDLDDDDLIREIGRVEMTSAREICLTRGRTLGDLAIKATVAAAIDGYDKRPVDADLEAYFASWEAAGSDTMMLSLLRDLLAGDVIGVSPLPILPTPDARSDS